MLQKFWRSFDTGFEDATSARLTRSIDSLHTAFSDAIAIRDHLQEFKSSLLQQRVL